MRTFACTVLAAILVAAPLTLCAAGGAARDKALLAARDAFLAGDRVKLARQAEKIRGHVLEPYVGYWRLRLRIEEADPGELRAFLARNAGTVLAEQLRREWLRVLGKNGQWELFRQEHPALVKEDPDVACYALQERWLSRDESVHAGDQALLGDAAAASRGVRSAGRRDAALRGSHAPGPARPLPASGPRRPVSRRRSGSRSACPRTRPRARAGSTAPRERRPRFWSAPAPSWKQPPGANWRLSRSRGWPRSIRRSR